MRKVRNGRLYDTEKSILLADDELINGVTIDNWGRNTYLYRTKKGHFFVHKTTYWQGEHNDIHPISKDEAKHLFESLREYIGYEAAFGEEPEEA